MDPTSVDAGRRKPGPSNGGVRLLPFPAVAYFMLAPALWEGLGTVWDVADLLRTNGH